VLSRIINNIREILDTLRAGKWSPLPYLKVEIPKKVKEKRRLGLLSIKDKGKLTR
jgi:retron-type reverse transcriptase